MVTTTVCKYLQVKYGTPAPTTMTKKDAVTIGLPYPPQTGWLKKHGHQVLSDDQVRNMIAAVSESLSKKTTEHQLRVLSGQLDRLQSEWPLDHEKCKSSLLNVQKHSNFVTAKISQTTVKKRVSDGFYETRAWRELRYKALVKYGARCQCCGANRDDGVRIHVDHIKPRSKFPDLQLELSNLQVLCEDCNIGKSNKDYTDWT